MITVYLTNRKICIKGNLPNHQQLLDRVSDLYNINMIKLNY